MNRQELAITFLTEVLPQLFQSGVKKIQTWEFQLVFVLSFVTYCIYNPSNAINQLAINIIDVVLVAWPSTPPQFTLQALYISLSSTFPFVGWVTVNEILQGLAGIIAIRLLFRTIKSLPFI